MGGEIFTFCVPNEWTALIFPVSNKLPRVTFSSGIENNAAGVTEPVNHLFSIVEFFQRINTRYFAQEEPATIVVEEPCDATGEVCSFHIETSAS